MTKVFAAVATMKKVLTFKVAIVIVEPVANVTFAAAVIVTVWFPRFAYVNVQQSPAPTCLD